MPTICIGQMQDLQLMMPGKLDLTHRKTKLDPYLSSCTRDKDLGIQTWNCCRKTSGVDFTGTEGNLLKTISAAQKIRPLGNGIKRVVYHQMNGFKKKWCTYTTEYYLVVKCLKYKKWNLHVNEWDWKNFTHSEVRANTTSSAFSLSRGDSGFYPLC